MSEATKNLDTIAAIATPTGMGGVGIIRVAGPEALNIAYTITQRHPKPRHAEFCRFLAKDGQIIDEGVVLYFKGPNSFTGDDVIEFQGHGGPVVIDRLLREIVQSRARLAKPGEFTERAFLNNKIDLTQAEAIADLISSQTEQAASAAARTLTGAFSKIINSIQEKLTHFRMYIEAAIDFPEEEIDFLTDSRLQDQLNQIMQTLADVFKKAQNSVLLQEGMSIVILGRPNAGKSTLLNYLAGREVAIVTAIAGTTRDVVKETIQLNGIPIRLIDTAGLRETDCPIEQEGIKRAANEGQTADHIFLLVEESAFNTLEELLQEVESLNIVAPMTILVNKIDLAQQRSDYSHYNQIPIIAISAKTGFGLDTLSQHLLGKKTEDRSENEFLARRRHLQALEKTERAMQAAYVHLQNRQGELIAEECRLAQQHLSEITGEWTADDLLGEIFSRFCIGK